ncbi:MAG: hypothetical protein ACI84C_000543 [Flavobacteriales bacterium]|jgi:hypothetical protein
MLYTYLIILTCVALVGSLTFGRVNKVVKPLLILVVYTAIHEWLVHSGLLPQNYSPYWLYAGISVSLYLEFMRRSIHHAWTKITLAVFSIAFCLAGIYFALFAANSFPSQFVIIGIAFIVFGCLLVLYSILQNITDQPISKNPIFIAIAAILIYQCVFFTYLGCLSFLMSNDYLNEVITKVHKWASIIYYAILGFVFYLSIKNSGKLIPHE